MILVFSIVLTLSINFQNSLHFRCVRVWRLHSLLILLIPASSQLSDCRSKQSPASDQQLRGEELLRIFLSKGMEIHKVIGNQSIKGSQSILPSRIEPTSQNNITDHSFLRWPRSDRIETFRLSDHHKNRWW